MHCQVVFDLGLGSTVWLANVCNTHPHCGRFGCITQMLADLQQNFQYPPTSNFVMLNFTPVTLAPLPISTQDTCAGMPCHSLLELAFSCSNWSICLCLCGGCDVLGQLLSLEY